MPASWRTLTHDILKQAYTFCGDGDLARCAQTCKNWTDPALDLIWFELKAEDFVNLFAILAPLRPAQVQSSDSLTRMEFSRPISHRDWKHFIPYSSRVRIMDGFDREERFSMLSEAALADLLITRPRRAISFLESRLFWPMENLYPIIRGASSSLVFSTTAFRNSTFTFPVASGRQMQF